MRLLRSVAIGLAAVSLIQAVAAVVLLCWAFPCFFNPTMLGNNAERVARRTSELSQLDPEAPSGLAGVDQSFLWYFWGHIEGVALAVAGEVVLSLSAVLSLAFSSILFLALRSWQGPAPNDSLKRADQSLHD